MMDGINHTKHLIMRANPFYDSVFRFIVNNGPRFALEIEVILVQWNRCSNL